MLWVSCKDCSCFNNVSQDSNVNLLELVSKNISTKSNSRLTWPAYIPRPWYKPALSRFSNALKINALSFIHVDQHTCSYTTYSDNTRILHNQHHYVNISCITATKPRTATYYSGYLLYFLLDWHHINLLLHVCHWQFPVWRHLCSVQIHISIRSIW